ncbi:MAG: efflux RND transporter periplasmic adaptor subunit [Lachnospiraceae bacterium]|nr:efflux RND transporter periplasmic adaptor subunit [Lachnospiraceae bacterium]
MSNKKKRILIGCIIAAVVIAAVVLILIFAGKASDRGKKIYVQSVRSLMGTDTFSNRFSGVVETQRSENIELDLSRQIEEVYVTEGTKVKSGTPLFSYNTDTLRLDIDQMSIEIEKYNTMIQNSSEEINQLRATMSTLPASEQLEYSAQIQQLQADIAQYQYDIKTKQANITAYQSAIDKSTVTSPLNGTVQKINDENAIRNGDIQGNEGNVFMVVTAEGDLRVKGSVGEQHIAELSQGLPVIIRSRVDTEQIWHGTVASINTQSTEQNNNDYYYGYDSGESSSKYSFYVNLDITEGLMLGQHVTIELDRGQGNSKDGIWLSSGFVAYTENDEPVIWAAKKDGAKLEMRKVTLGIYDAELDMFEIQDGISADEYVAWPSSDCKAGMPTTTVMTYDNEDYVDYEEYVEDYADDYGKDGDYGVFDGGEGMIYDGANVGEETKE